MIVKIITLVISKTSFYSTHNEFPENLISNKVKLKTWHTRSTEAVLKKLKISKRKLSLTELQLTPRHTRINNYTSPFHDSSGYEES